MNETQPVKVKHHHVWISLPGFWNTFHLFIKKTKKKVEEFADLWKQVNRIRWKQAEKKVVFLESDALDPYQ